jgi:dGTPase
MEKDIGEATLALRDFLFERVYKDNEAKAEEEKADRMIEILYDFLIKNPERLPVFYLKLSEKYGKSVSVCDYISSMSDRYAVYTFEKYFVPSSWKLDKN